MPVPAIDFIAGAVAHRRKFGGGKSQMLAKAAGIKDKLRPSVLDLTAGLGKDAFVLACLGCEVTLVERHSEVFDALTEALDRATSHARMEDAELLAILRRMQVFQGEALEYLRAHQPLSQQVIYLDPMFPERKKSAAVKKEMVLLQELVGDDPDADQLLEASLLSGARRVVVKRPRLAPCLAGRQPSLVFEGKSSRFDVYPLLKLG